MKLKKLRVLFFIILCVVSTSSLFAGENAQGYPSSIPNSQSPSSDKPPVNDNPDDPFYDTTNGGNGQGGPSLEEEKERERELEKQKEELENENDDISSASDSDASDKAKDSEKQNDKKVTETETENENKKTQNEKESKSEKDSKKADKDGDPVRITKGCYEQNETDLIIGNSQFEIKRFYKSDNTIYSSLGYGWGTNLDQRIILGIEPDLQKIIDEINNYLKTLNDTINNLEKTLCSAYKVSGVYNAKNEINQRINNCNSLIPRIELLLLSIEGFEDRVRSYSELYSDAASLEKSTERLLDSVKVKKNQLEKIYVRLDYDISVINYLKEKHSAGNLKLQEYMLLLEKQNQRIRDNQKALFSGTNNLYLETGLHTITVIDEEGYPCLLFETEDGWENENNFEYLRCEKAENGYTLYESNDFTKQFDENGLLEKITDRNGNTVTISRNTDGKILNVFTSMGERFCVEYNGEFITKIYNQRASEENVCYSYDDRKLTEIIDYEGDAVSMEYDDNNHMTALLKCDGSSVIFNYGEQTSDGNILTTSTVNEEGYEETFEYNRSGRCTVYTDHDGNRHSYWFDENQQTVRELLPDGTLIENQFDDSGNLTEVNENGCIRRYEYDGKGNRLTALYDDGSYEKWTYDDFNLPLSFVDRDGVREDYVRDTKGNLLELKKGGKTVYEQEYNENGFVIKKTVYGQHPVVTHYEYDSFGNLIFENCNGIKKEYRYDSRNRLLQILINDKEICEYEYKAHEVIKKDYNGLVTSVLTNGRKDIVKIVQTDLFTDEVHQIRIEYDKRHLPVRVFTGNADSEELTVSYQYTREGKIRAEIKHGKENWITLYEYNNSQIGEIKQFKSDTMVEPVATTMYTRKYTSEITAGNRKLITITDGLGIRNLFEYDSYGNLIKTTDGNGSSVQKKYSSASRLIKNQTVQGGWYTFSYNTGLLDAAGEEGAVPFRMEYNPDGSIREQTDRYGIKTRYSYDNSGRLSCTQNNTKTVWYEYDSLNRIKKVAVANTVSSVVPVYFAEYDYSDDGRSITLTEGGKYKTSFVLDAFGNVVSQKKGNENIRTYEYDCYNRVKAVIDGYGNKTSYYYNALHKISGVVLPEGGQILYDYNSLGQLSEISDECGCVYKAKYDQSGRLVKEKMRGDTEKQYEYDRAGRIVKLFYGGEIVESYVYGTDNRSTTVKDGNGNDYLYKYDGFGRLINEKNRLGLLQQYSYDADGQLRSRNDFSADTTAISCSPDRSIETINFADGSQSRFVYDVLGNIVEAQNAYGKTIYQYDQGARLIYQKDVVTGEEITFEYDAAGNRTVLHSSNRETFYTYGRNNEIKEIFDNKQRLRVKLTYNKNGQEVLRQFGNGTKEETLYDKAGRISVRMQKNERGDLLWGEAYVYGSDGKRSMTVDNECRVTLYQYDNKGQLSEVLYPYSVELQNNLKNEAEENGLPVTAEVTENRFLTTVEKNALIPLLNSMQYGLSYKLSNLQVFIKESYSYDKNGNRILKIIPYGTIEYSYDKENCLVSSGSHGQVYVKYGYDVLGNLLSEDSDRKTVKYAYNAQNRLVYCEVNDKLEKNYCQSTYAYDAFGRRLLVQDKDEVALRTLYDGLTFDVIKQSPVYAGGLFTDSFENGIRWGSAGKPTGDRYRYLDNENSKDENRYYYLSEGTYKTVTSRYRGERTELYINGSIAAQTTSNYGSEYFSTDLLGSIRNTTDSYGQEKSSYTYDAFGTLIKGAFSGASNHGYLAKPYDQSARLYNYGFRDYAPATSRFTTQDPLRDGPNWFTYCHSDPVNFIDLYGLYYYSGNEQNSITTVKKTTVVILREHNGLGDEFDSARLIYKNDGINTTLVYVDRVGANCSKENYNAGLGNTTPDGTYYFTTKSLNKNEKGTYDSKTYDNVLALATKDQNLTQEQRDSVNIGDRLSHANQFARDHDNTTSPYNSNKTPGGAGCIIGKDGQDKQDKMMETLMDGVQNPESITVIIKSMKHIEGCGK